MPRVHFIKKARKDNPAVKRGESYYYWTTRMTVGKLWVGHKHYSAGYPKRSQLTSSEFLATMYDIEDRIGSIGVDILGEDRGMMASEIDDVRSELENLQSETQDKLDNMPEQLQEGDTGQMLQSRIDEIDSMTGELDSIDCEDDDNEYEDLLAQISGISYGGE